MASNIDQLVQDAVKSVERKLSADMRKFGDYIVQNIQDIKKLMEGMEVLGQSLNNLYDEIRETQDTVAKINKDKDLNIQASFHDLLSPPARAPSPMDDETQGVSSDALFSEQEVIEIKRIVSEKREQKRQERDGYYRRTILVRNLINQNDDSNQNLSFYRQCAKSLRDHGMEFILYECDKFFVLNSGSVRFTYETRSKAICFLIEARRVAQGRRSHLQFDIMVPPERMTLRKKIQDFGKRMKADRLIQSYQAYESRGSGSWKFNLRIFIHGFGQYLFKSSDFDCFEELVDRTKELINSFGVIGIAEIERMQPEE